MKKILCLTLVLIFTLTLCSCSFVKMLWVDLTTPNAEWLSNPQVEYYPASKLYHISFSFKSDNGEYVRIGGSIKARIVNNYGDEVYNDTLDFTKDDYTMRSNVLGSILKANAYIDANEIEKGSSNKGTIYLEITAADGRRFDEKPIEIDNLPTK